MSRKHTTTTVAALAAALASASPAFADSVLLRNGRRIEGHVIRQNDREVTIETTSGVLMSFEIGKVERVERDDGSGSRSTPSPGTATTKPEEAVAPEGASDDEIERLRNLASQIRDVARRLEDARREKREADQDGSSAGVEQARLAAARSQELESELANLKLIRDGIVRSSALRRENADKRAAAEAAAIRAETDQLRDGGDSAALLDRAQKLKARTPQDARDPSHAPLLAEAVHALVAAAETDLAKAQSATPSVQASLERTAADRFALAASWAEGPDASSLRDRAVKAYSDAHRMSGPRPIEIERELEKLHAFRACADLVEDRLGERRWGVEVGEREAGQYRIELADGRVSYADDAPSIAEARSVRERRDRTERRTTKDDTGGTTVTLVKVTRWYDLVWDPGKKRWARESPASQLEAQQLVGLLRSAQEKADGLDAALAERGRAQQALAAKRAATLAVRWQADAGDVGADVLANAIKELRGAEKAVAAADEAITLARSGVDERLRELASLDKQAERARTGG